MANIQNTKLDIINKIVEVEKNIDGWLMTGYKNEAEFKADLMKEENFDDLLKYYSDVTRISNNEEYRDYAWKLIDMIQEYQA